MSLTLAQAFDRIASSYVDLVEPNPLHAHLRAASLAWLDDAFCPGMHVLEVGCGPGIEAVHLARRGVAVTATDISQGMVEVARNRVQENNLSRLIAIERCSASDVPSRYAEGSFDGAYASLGSLNGESDFFSTVQGIARVLKPGAPFLFSVVSRPCVSELVIASVHLAFRKAFRRFKTLTEIHLVGADSVAVSAVSEGDVRLALAPSFTIDRIEGLLVALPPPYFARTWARLGILHPAAQGLDRRLRIRWPFRGWGDHLHVWAVRRA